MKKFLVNTVIFSIIAVLLIFLLLYKVDGYSDSFYVKFTTPKQSSLIIGTSRAAQGLQPRVFDSILENSFSNYSFSVLHSPFGKTYLNSIKRKLDLRGKQGVFVITVDPWSLSSFTNSPEDSLSFRELNLALGNTKIVDVKPNPFYLLNNRSDRFYELIIDKQSNSFLHADGWLEVNMVYDSIKEVENIDKKVANYKKNMLPKAKYSQTRYNYLIKTINFLKPYGDVYLVRLPIHKKMEELDNIIMPNLENDIKEAIGLSNGYLDLTPLSTNFKYTDGNHLHKISGKKVSIIIAKWIADKQ